jgi:hypothetical protein
MLKQLSNAALFQLGWFACVFSPAQPWLLLVALGLLGLQLFCLSSWAQDGKLLVSAAVLGTAVDSLLLHLGVFDFGQPRWLIPLWLILLWPLLASTLKHSLAWSGKPWWRGSLLGALSAPLSYYAGAQLAGVSLPYGTTPTLLGLALLWSGLLPLLHYLARHFQRSAGDPQ